MRLLLIALLPLTLAGCWTGMNLYSASDARPAIPSGVYIASGSDEPQHVYRVSTLSNGMTQFDGQEDKTQVYGFAPLGMPNAFVAWWEIQPNPKGRPAENDENQMYALVVRKSDVSFLIFAPPCSDEAADLARKHGAVIGAGPSPTCRFPNRRSLEAALLQLPRDEAEAMTLKRVP
jgi:hypothetical protein